MNSMIHRLRPFQAVSAVCLLLLCVLSANGFAQCPQITIDEKYDHVPLPFNRERGWDTVVNCVNSTLTLHATPFITTQHFNGTYLVESIPYAPVDPTFHAGNQLNISSDDVWENSAISFPFNFVYFGYTYNQAVVGSNGIVTFNSGAVAPNNIAPTGLSNKIGQYCAYSYSVPIPSTSFPELNAIYGVYEDIDPRGLSTGQGMFRSIGGTYPCRYLCASVNQVPLYPYSSNSNNRCTYQIVCYEGTNIIEVHVSQRSCCSSTNSGKGLIGIQNSTGSTQESHYHGQDGSGTPANHPTFHIQPNSPGAFVADNRGNQSGGWTGTATQEAWRFTPQGETTKNISWWRLIKNDRGEIIDSVEFTTEATDTNGVYLTSDHLQVSISPTQTTSYVVKCVYQGANGFIYGIDKNSMRDTITVGMDRGNSMRVETQNGIICEGNQAVVTMSYNTEDLVLESCTWKAAKEYNGQRTTLPESSYRAAGSTVTLLRQINLVPNHIDSVWIYCTATFMNGCSNYDSILIQTFPNFNIYDTAGICNGNSFTWCGEEYTTPGDYRKEYHSQPGCDSIHYLHLVVSNTSHTVEPVVDCQAFVWKNGKTYTKDNDATRDIDTIVLKNKYGCDSVVTLDFTLMPVKAVIAHTPEVATLDTLTIELTDQSINSSGRNWITPDGRPSAEPTNYVIFPLTGIDTMEVKLIAISLYGQCLDTAAVKIPLHKVSAYAPNAFTPDRPENNKFRVFIKGNITKPQVWVYNRFGVEVCYFEGEEGYWDGTAQDGTPCPMGTYVYILRYHDSRDPLVTQQVKGTITLIR